MKTAPDSFALQRLAVTKKQTPATAATKIQANVRRYIKQTAFKTTKNAAVTLQTLDREVTERSRFPGRSQHNQEAGIAEALLRQRVLSQGQGSSIFENTTMTLELTEIEGYKTKYVGDLDDCNQRMLARITDVEKASQKAYSAEGTQEDFNKFDNQKQDIIFWMDALGRQKNDAKEDLHNKLGMLKEVLLARQRVLSQGQGSSIFEPEGATDMVAARQEHDLHAMETYTETEDNTRALALGRAAMAAKAEEDVTNNQLASIDRLDGDMEEIFDSISGNMLSRMEANREHFNELCTEAVFNFKKLWKLAIKGYETYEATVDECTQRMMKRLMILETASNKVYGDKGTQEDFNKFESQKEDIKFWMDALGRQKNDAKEDLHNKIEGLKTVCDAGLDMAVSTSKALYLDLQCEREELVHLCKIKMDNQSQVFDKYTKAKAEIAATQQASFDNLKGLLTLQHERIVSNRQISETEANNVKEYKLKFLEHIKGLQKQEKELLLLEKKEEVQNLLEERKVDMEQNSQLASEKLAYQMQQMTHELNLLEKQTEQEQNQLDHKLEESKQVTGRIRGITDIIKPPCVIA